MNSTITLTNASNVDKNFALSAFSDNSSVRVSEDSSASSMTTLKIIQDTIRSGRKNEAVKTVIQFASGITDANAAYIGDEVITLTVTALVNGVTTAKRADLLAFMKDFINDQLTAALRGEK